MDHHSDIAEFLTTRRAKITPEQAGLPSYGQRRVPGLRREEVASLAGVSVEYYKRLERGNVSGVSELRARRRSPGRCSSTTPSARTSSTSPAPPIRSRRSGRRPVKQRVRPVVQRLLDQIDGAGDRAQRAPRLPGGQRARPRALRTGVRQPRAARQQRALHVPRSRGARTSTRSGSSVASELVAHLRSQAGRNPYDRAALGPRSASCRRAATSSGSAGRRTTCASTRPARKHIHHPVVGELELSYETLTLDADDGLSVGALHRRAGVVEPAGAGPARQLERAAARRRRAAEQPGAQGLNRRRPGGAA